MLEAGLNLPDVRKVHLAVALFLTSQVMCLRESYIRETRTCSLSGGRKLARKRASSDPTMARSGLLELLPICLSLAQWILGLDMEEVSASRFLRQLFQESVSDSRASDGVGPTSAWRRSLREKSLGRWRTGVEKCQFGDLSSMKFLAGIPLLSCNYVSSPRLPTSFLLSPEGGCMFSYRETTFDPRTFLAQAGLGKAVLRYPKNKVIFAQGEPCDAVFYIQEGRVKVTVVSTRGKEATVALLGVEDFIGESCLTSQPLRIASATAITDCCVLRIEKETLLSLLHCERAFPDFCVAYLVSRNNQIQEDLVDQLSNSAEKRPGLSCCWPVLERKEKRRP
jgi:CRP-like cAMP-binding protein